MIWFDWIAERRLSHEELRRALAAVTEYGYHEVAVIDDISALGQVPVTCLVVCDSDARFGQHLSVYAAEHVIEVLQQKPLSSIARRLAQATRAQVLIADDETPDPYQMLMFDAGGGRSLVQVDGALLDDFGIVEFKRA